MHVSHPCESTMLLLLLFVNMVPPFRSYSAEDRLRCVSAPGDIIIGGLFPIHGQTNRTTVPGPVSCTNYDLQMFLRAQVMIFAIEEINQRSPRILPNLMMGYEIYDTCGDVTFAMGATLKLLMAKSDGQSYFLPGPKPPDAEPLTVPEAHVKVVIGERYSEVSIAVARLFALSSVAQISYGSTSELLSRKLKFPTFLRTLSSDTHQTKAIAKLVKQFNWQIVAIVGSDDEYGKYGSERLFDNLDEMNVCIEFKEILPSYFEFNQTKTHHKLSKLMKQLKQSSAEAVVLFTKTVNIAIIMEAAIQQNLNRTWIASDTWSTSQRISEMPGIQKAGRVFGFISRRNEVPGFKDYVTSKLSKTTNPFLQHHWIHYPPCPSEMNSVTNCSLSQSESKKCLHPSCLVEYTDQDESYNVYLAVKVVAEGLRRLLKCDSKKCERDANFTALELLMAIKQVNFTVNSTRIFFDDNGDPSIGYDIVQWNMTESTQRIKTIGEYWPNENIKLPDDLIRKMHNVTVTAYNCSKTCQPGFELKQQSQTCCRKCLQCQEGDFSPGDGMECKPCHTTENASPQRDKCLNKTVRFLQWSNPFVIALSSFDILGIIATVLVAVLFTIHRRTPVVKAVGGYLCFLELFSLLVCFCLTFMLVAKPTELFCRAGLPLFVMAFTLCISCILANLLQILVGFSFDQGVGAWLKRLNHPTALVAVIFGIQLILCVLWLTIYPSFPYHLDSRKTVILVCKIRSYVLFGATFGYNSILAFVCLLFAFKGKWLPDLYKNASFLTISMLLFLVIWIVFIPIHINVYEYTGALEAAAILVSSYSILFCHLAPKCYIMVFRKEINNEHAITEYIRKHYEQKGVTVVKS